MSKRRSTQNEIYKVKQRLRERERETKVKKGLRRTSSKKKWMTRSESEKFLEQLLELPNTLKSS